MNAEVINKEYTLSIERTFNAPIEKVFNAWINTQALTKWFAPSDQMKTEVLKLDVNIGGQYCLKMVNDEGEEYVIAGEYISIQPNKELIFTWQWQSHEDSAEMLITLKFSKQGNKTNFTLLQERIPSQESRDEHNKGWDGCLARLEKRLLN